MIGSHNTLSYLPPKNLWGKITRLWNKCQDKTIEEQFNRGVDYFDIRINFYSDNNWHFVHNRVDYGIIDKTIWKYIGETNLPVRVIYDRRSKPKDCTHEAHCFEIYLWYIRQKYNVNIDSAITYWDWKEYCKPFIKVKEFHASVSSKLYQYLLVCKWFAINYNTFGKDITMNDLTSINEVLLLDYV